MRVGADEQGRALCLAGSQWDQTREHDPFWDSYWSVWSPDDVVNATSTESDHRAQHLMGALQPDERLLSIEVQIAGRDEWSRCIFAVAGGLAWLAHAPRWTTRALITTSARTKDVSFTYRRYAEYNQDMPEGVNEIPAS